MKTYTLLSVIINALILAFVTSCSDTSLTTKNANDSEELKHYSSATNQEFQTIEKSDPIAPNYHNPKKQVKASPVQSVQDKISKQPIGEIQLVTDTTLSTKNQERLQEINQNLAFYCMKHRKTKAFKNEDQCLLFTKKILNTCEKKHKIINTVMVNCIKDRLKKRR